LINKEYSRAKKNGVELQIMLKEQLLWTEKEGWQPKTPQDLSGEYQLALVFASRGILEHTNLLKEISSHFAKAKVLGCSTAGEICGTKVLDNAFVVTLVHFHHTELKQFSCELLNKKESYNAGEYLARKLFAPDLVHVLTLCEGLNVNGDEFVRGMNENLPRGVNVTGGLAGDGDRFKKTLIVSGAASGSNVVSALGFYSRKLKVGYASLGGWDPFGPERLVTKSDGNVLYELDGKSALDLYKLYLGEQAAGLPATGLLFPLSLRMHDNKHGIVRTILSVEEKNKSMTFAGNIPEGSYVRLMKANFNRLIDGAVIAASNCVSLHPGAFIPELAILISCVGRKMILKQRVEEEVEGVRDILGDKTVLAGFYSYGEISPLVPGTACELHNQTMTITAFSEK
jgi:hypothetical protein